MTADRPRPLLSASCILLLSINAVLIQACTSAQPQASSEGAKELTVGVVQRDIRKGMSQADVAEALGSPNIVTKDQEDHETWIYDRIATEVRASAQDSYATLILVGGSQRSAQTTTSQKTLTVVIKFGPDKKITSFSYHASKF